MYTSGQYLDKINERLAILKYEIEGAALYGLTNINRYSEGFMKTLLNITFNLQLINLNDEFNNFPGLDLGDKSKSIAFQITSTRTSAKVNDTLATCLKFKSYQVFETINIFILGSKQDTYSINVITKPNFDFTSDKNIYDFDSLQRIFGACDAMKLKAILDFMDLELPYLQGRLQIARHPIFKIPFERNPFFTGREQAIKSIFHGFKNGNQIAIRQAISGLGGIGKSQTALEYAHSYRDVYTAIFWVVADTEATLQSGFLEIATLLFLNENEKEVSIIVNKVRNWLQENDNWLLILDNADDLSVIKGYLPVNARGHILFTSRASSFDLFGFVSLIELNTLSESDAIKFLVKRTGISTLTEEDEKSCKMLAHELGCLPLALEQAGAFMKEHQVTFSRYLDEFRKDSLYILDLKNPVAGDYQSTVSRTWLMNFESIASQFPGSKYLLYYTSFVSPDSIPFELIKDGYYQLPLSDPDFRAQIGVPFAFERNLQPLINYSLVKRESSSKSYSIHRLVQTAVKNSLSNNSQELWARIVCQSLNSLFPDASFNTWPMCERLTSHALHAVQYIDQYTFHFEDCGNFLDGLACYLRMRGNFQLSEQTHLKSLFIRERDCGPESVEITMALNNLSLVYTDQLQFPQALSLLKRALTINEKLRSIDDYELSLPNNNLGMAYLRGKQVEKAIIYLEKALKLERSSPNPAEFFVALILNNLAEAYLGIGEIDKAEKYCEEGLIIRESIGNPEKTTRSYTVMASILLKKRKFVEAENFVQKSITMTEAVFGKYHPELLRVLEVYKMLLADLNRKDDLKAIEDQIEMIYKKYNLSPIYLENHH